MASGPITSWQIDGKKWQILFFLGSQITVDSECSHWIKRCLLLGRKTMTNLDSILKSRDTTLTIKVSIVKATVFLVVMYGCESWTIKKAECQRIGAFELWCWRRLLRVRWTARRSNQSILKEINPEYSLEGLMLNLKLQYFGHLLGKADSLEKTLMLGKIEGKRRRGRWLNGHQFSSVQSFSSVRLFVTPWTPAHQASLSITNSQNLLKLMSIESVMPSNHLILCHPLLLLPSIFPSVRVFSNESVLCIRLPKY